MARVAEAGVPFQIGFNRRFDPGYAELARAVRAGELGRAEMFRSQSTDPTIPPESYVAVSGGIYLDSVIHDIDSARFVMGEIDRVTALGRVLVAPFMERHGDVDTSILTLEFASGAIGVIQNSRRSVYGHDLRLEVHGEHGKLVSESERSTAVWRYGDRGIGGDYVRDFIERFREAYLAELQAFTKAVLEGDPPSPGPEDAIESLRVALAARKSLHEGSPGRHFGGDMKLANAPCSWGTIENTAGDRIGYRQMLDELAATDYVGTELGDWGFMPTDPERLAEELRSRGLTLIGSWVTVRLYDEAYHAAGAEQAVRVARLMATVSDDRPSSTSAPTTAACRSATTTPAASVPNTVSATRAGASTSAAPNGWRRRCARQRGSSPPSTTTDRPTSRPRPRSTPSSSAATPT